MNSRVLCAVLLVTSAIGGCTKTDPVDSYSEGPWAQVFSEEAQHAESEFIRAVLADGRVDDVEMQEARQRTVECLRDAGITAWYSPADKYGFRGLTTEGQPYKDEVKRESIRECEHQWMGAIGGLYEQTRTNPNNEDWDVLTVACLIRKGLAPEGFTVEDYRALNEASGWVTTGDEEEVEHTENPAPPGTVLLPSGVDITSDEAFDCSIVPLE